MNNMRNNSAAAQGAAQAASYDAGLRKYMLGVYNYMTGGVALTGFVAYLMANMLPVETLLGMQMPFFIGMLAYAFLVLPRIMGMSVQKAQLAYWGYTVLVGGLISALLKIYTGLDVTRAFIATTGAFAGLSLYGYTTKKDLSAMGSFLIMGAWGLLITLVMNAFFFQSAGVHYVMCFLGVGIFAGLTAFETQRIRQTYYQVAGNAEVAVKASIIGALSLYGSFLNMFIFLLQIMGNRE